MTHQMQSTYKTITLVMIVKNESKVIQRCFDSVKDYIDYWIICDTGSTDGTQDLIKKYFENANIPGKLYDHKWVNFGFNRTLAVSLAKGKSDYSILLDADFLFKIKDKTFKNNLISDAYQIKYEGNLDYRQTLFVKSSFDWKYVGVTHEYLTCPAASKYENLNAFTIHHLCDGGSRSDKFVRDIDLLKKGLIDEPTNIRYMFYLAQSYNDTEDYTNAIKYYEMRILCGGWPEEVYFSLYKIGNCKMMRGDKYPDIRDSFLKAYKYRPQRLEALHDLIKYCRLNDMSGIGFNYGMPAINTKYPNDILFINKPVHEWMFLDEVALCAYNIQKLDISIELYDKFLKKGYVGVDECPRIKSNYNFFQKQVITDTSNKVEVITDTSNKVAIIIVNYNMKERADAIIDNLKKTVKHPYDIILVDNGSDLIEESKNTSLKLQKNVQTTNGWLMGLHYADSLEIINNEKYFAYCFVITSVKLVETKKDIISTMVKTMKDDDVVGVHPSLTSSSTTSWKQFINTPNKCNEHVYFIDNIFSCYRATWFNKIGRFNPKLTYAWGIDIETGYFASIDKKKIILDNSIQVEKETDIDYKMNRMKMSSNERTKNASKQMNSYFINCLNNDINYQEIFNTELNLKSDYEKFTSNSVKIDTTLEKGLSFLIRAKNEEKNIINCLSSLINVTKKIDNIEIIVIDNNSCDETNKLVKIFMIEHKNVKLYTYNFEVCKIGNNISTGEHKTIATYYNWCLEKVTKYNVVKWDADFIANKDTLYDMIISNNLNTRDDNFTLWFKGETLFLHNDTYLKKVYSLYDSYKIFSKRYFFKWHDYNNVCEDVDISNIPVKEKYNVPVFYEIFNTGIDEFLNKISLIDNRDVIDKKIFNELSRNSIYYDQDNKSQLEKFNFIKNYKNKLTYFVIYYGYHSNVGGTYMSLKTYVDYFISKGDIVYVFERIPCDDEINKLKPDCIISAQFAITDVTNNINKWNIPLVALTYGPSQYIFNKDSKYPSLVTYSNSYIKSNDTLQKNGYVVRDPINHKIYEITKENMEPTYITLIGSPPNIKGHNIFIELAKRFENLKFMLVTHINNYKDIQLPNNITLVNYISDIKELKKNVYSKIKVLLLPSIQEAYGRVTIEAIASNIPCIISDYPGLSEATFNMSNYIKDYKDVNKWEEELKRVLENYENEVEKSNKIKLKLDFERDINEFRDLVIKCIENYK
jgi:glycosyltransferase involved in cell wall biosynthesis